MGSGAFVLYGNHKTSSSTLGTCVLVLFYIPLSAAELPYGIYLLSNTGWELTQ